MAPSHARSLGRVLLCGLLLCGLHLGLSADQPGETPPLSIWSRGFLALRANKDEIKAFFLSFSGIAVGTASILRLIHQTSTKSDVQKTNLAKAELCAQQIEKLKSDLEAARKVHAVQLKAEQELREEVKRAKAEAAVQVEAEQELREESVKRAKAEAAVQLKAEQQLREESVKRAKAEAVKEVLQMLGQEQYSQLMTTLLNSSKAG